jgi:transcriptional regulator with XRE-family HTH domain
MSTIAEKIKAYRAKHNLTQEKFAERVGLTQGAISMLESGKGSTRA